MCEGMDITNNINNLMQSKKTDTKTNVKWIKHRQMCILCIFSDNVLKFTQAYLVSKTT